VSKEAWRDERKTTDARGRAVRVLTNRFPVRFLKGESICCYARYCRTHISYFLEEVRDNLSTIIVMGQVLVGLTHFVLGAHVETMAFIGLRSSL
jgi:hypothetical protein